MSEKKEKLCHNCKFWRKVFPAGNMGVCTNERNDVKRPGKKLYLLVTGASETCPGFKKGPPHER